MIYDHVNGNEDNLKSDFSLYLDMLQFVVVRIMLINAFSLYSQYDCGMALGSLSDGKVGLHYPDYPTTGEDKDPSKPGSHPDNTAQER